MEMDATKSRRRNGHGRTKRDGQKVSGINKSKPERESRREKKAAAAEELQFKKNGS